MEQGQQNFSTDLLDRISAALHAKLLSVSDSLDFRVQGSRKLSGKITTNTSKNGALGVLAASLINAGTTVIHGVPQIEEVFRFYEILESMGFKIDKRAEKTVAITRPKKIDIAHCNEAAVKRVRSALMLVGPLVHLLPHFTLPRPGGCKMGSRTTSAHEYALELLGIRCSNTGSKGIEIKVGKLHPADIAMYEASDTATINALLAASLIPGTTRISFASANYQVQEVCFFLDKLGIKIDGVGTTELAIHGIKEVNLDVEYYLAEDPIESMMFISSAVTTGSKLTIERCPIDFLKLELYKLEKMGFKYEFGKKGVYYSENGRTKLVDLTVFPSKLSAPHDKLHAQSYPGINSDNLPFFVPIATQASGTTLIHDWMWENRAIYFTELNRLGANITLLDPHRVLVQGPTELRAAQIVCPPALRPAMIVLIAMLAAEGTSTLRNVYSINRGYEDVAQRLNDIGASVEVLTNAQ
jgi:UDP-N-acetylglucosamine 1-carboxyvinyltransferase